MKKYWMFLLALCLGIFFQACQKETVIVEECDEPTAELVLTAYLDAPRQVLYAIPTELDAALEALGAHPFTGNNIQAYEMQGVNVFGEPVTIRFDVEPVNNAQLNQLATTSDAAQMQLEGEFTGAGGTTFRVYKNATCGPVQAGFFSPCEAKTNGSSVKREWLPLRVCVPGNAICTQALLIGGYEHTYELAGCQGPLQGSKPIKMYQCWQ
ncbi:MAG: hypothetical protein HUU34_08875 [Saprospiraceae bacterium]|jgi:hypothetical protein|nr:hypothetical protein [Saprospiraceae bacterium]